MRTTPTIPLLALLSCAFAATAQQDDHPALALADLDAGIPWIDDGSTFLDGRRAKRSLSKEEQELDRSALIDRAAARAKKEGKLVLWYVYRIIEGSSRGRQMYRAPILDIYTRQVLFADPGVVGIVNNRFVPVRCVCDESLSARFGLRPLDFVEPAVVFLNGDGEVVHFVERLRTFDALWFADLLRRVLREKGLRAPPAGDATPAELLARGAWHEALAAAAARDDIDAENLLLQARIQRLLRRPQQAHALLERIAEVAGREHAGPLALETGRLLMMEGKVLQALVPLEKAWRSGLPEGGYLKALAQLRLGDEMGAMQRFLVIAQRHPNTVWGRRATANSTLGPDERPMGAAFAGFEHFGYLPEAAYTGLPRDTTWAGDPQAPADLAVRAVQFLLQQQRDDGGWTDARYAYWPSSEITPNTWVAITALCATALLEFRDLDPERIDPALIDRALVRAEGFMLDPKRLNRNKNEDSYSDSYRMLYLARKVRKQRDSTSLRHLNRIIGEAQQRQAEDGFFAHEYKNAFATGAVLWGLLSALEAGASVPDEMLSKGATALVSARHEDGSFSYSGTAARRSSNLKDSAGRAPMCEAILLRVGTGTPQRLRFALDNYWQHMDRMEKVRRNDFHSDGELAGFFFFHNLFHTSEVLQILPEQERQTMNARFLETLQSIPEMDGSFVDSHEFGRSYGTAMALLTLRNVVDWQ